MFWKRTGIRLPTLGLLCPLFLVAALLHASPAAAVPLDAFVCVEGNSVGCAVGAVLRGEVFEDHEGISLTLFNDAEASVAIAGVFIESAWVEAASGDGAAGTHFAPDGTPQPLPGAPGFDTSASATASPSAHNGVGPGEFGWFVLTLVEGASFEDLLADLRVGIRVTPIEGEGGASFIAEPNPEPIPEPTSFGLLLLGLVPLALVRRRRS